MKKNVHSKGLSVLTLMIFSLMLSGQSVRYDLVADGFSAPIEIQFEDDRIFVAEQDGLIKIIQNGMTLAEPFLNLTGLTDQYGEQGLLGMAFHPMYTDNGFLYVNYIRSDGSTVVSRFGTSANANIADLSSEKIILVIDQPFSNHNGGCLRFGPDGYLYIGMGDGGSGGDPRGNGQLRTTLLGKMLRIDVDTDDPYEIPMDNPFAEDDFTLDEIWALGLRNPWRFSFDSETGDLWIGDVGQNQFEEIDLQLGGSAGGENYGWRCKEANEPFNTTDCPDDSAFTDPVLTIAQGPDCSVTGGNVYRGSDIPELIGTYVFGDFCSGRIYTLVNNGGTWESDRLPNMPNPSSFGQDKDGEMYIAGYSSGEIVKIVNLISSTDQIEDLKLSLNVYPNPTTDVLHISIVGGPLDTELQARTSIYDASGSMIYDVHTNHMDDLNLNVKDWPDGIYTVQTITKNGAGSAKFVKLN